MEKCVVGRIMISAYQVLTFVGGDGCKHFSRIKVGRVLRGCMKARDRRETVGCRLSGAASFLAYEISGLADDEAAGRSNRQRGI